MNIFCNMIFISVTFNTHYSHRNSQQYFQFFNSWHHKTEKLCLSKIQCRLKPGWLLLLYLCEHKIDWHSLWPIFTKHVPRLIQKRPLLQKSWNVRHSFEDFSFRSRRYDNHLNKLQIACCFILEGKIERGIKLLDLIETVELNKIDIMDIGLIGMIKAKNTLNWL